MRSRNIFIAVVLLALSMSLDALSQGDLLIIAPDQFIDELQALKRFKNASGRPTTLISLTNVYGSFSGDDEAEQVKRCIAYYENSKGVKYVMMVGDIDRFPARYRWWGLPNQEYWGVSDLYYADLYENGTKTFDDWDVNNNGLYGEIEFSPDGTINNDHIDFLPDVAVGRIPASTGAEVTAYVTKIIAYEMGVAPSDTWFKRAGLYTGTWPSSNNNTVKDQIGGYLANEGFTLIKRYTNWGVNPPDPPPGVPAAIISDMNGGIGFGNYLGHGNAESWHCVGLHSSHLSGLNNSSRLPVLFAAACDTGMFARMARFHPYVDINGNEHCGTDNGEVLNPGAYPHTGLLPYRPAPVQDDGGDGGVQCGSTFHTFDRHCIAETFIFGNPSGSNTGAIAYLGARTGGQATIVDLDRHFFKAYDEGRDVLGDMWKYMLEQYYTQHNLADSYNWWRAPSQWRVGHTFDEPQKVILFGDPSLVVGGAFPIALSGNVFDFPFIGPGPLTSYRGYRTTGNATVPVGYKLTALAGSRILFKPGTKLVAYDSYPVNGFIANATASQPIHFLAHKTASQTLVTGMRLKGQMRLRNGGGIKFY